MQDFSTLSIQNVIIHEVIKQNKSDDKVPPIYSEIESPLDNEIKNFLKDKVINTIGSKRSQEIILNEELPSPLPEIVTAFFSNNFENNIFINLSKKIASHLNEIQGGRNPGGFVNILQGSNCNQKIIGILKIEREEGARLEQSERNGKKTYEITNIKDLVLSPHTKLLKICVFYKIDEVIEGRICDNQLTSKGEVADFFLKSFLGCQLKYNPATKTKEFYEASLRFIKDKVDDPRIQSKYKLHLHSYISNEGRKINPRIFATSSLDVNYRDEYERYLGHKGIEIGDFIKDTSYIDSKIEKMMLEFENGIQIVGTQRDFDQKVSVQSLENGNTKAIVESKLKKI
jgi:hypothetical protein